MRTAPARVAAGDLTDTVDVAGSRYLVLPLVDDFAVFRANAYPVALYARDTLALAGWMLHLPWAKNPAPMNRSGARGGWRDAAHQARTVRDVAYSLALGRIPLQSRIRVLLHWHVVTKRTRDEDNLVRCMKHLVDGLKLAGVVVDDDRTYVLRDMPEIHHRPTSAGGYAHMRLYVLIAE